MNLLFDIGTNEGLYTQDILKSFANCTIVCVEPQTELANRLKSNFKYQINEGQIFVYEKAASDKEGSTNLYPCSDHAVATISEEFRRNSCFAASEKLLQDGKMFKDHYKFYDPISVETITIDGLIETHGIPDLIKLDVEGHEYEALLGLTQKVPMITFEWHEPLKYKVIKALEHLGSIGFIKFSTEIWHYSREYHDNEITDYKTADEFIPWFTSCLEEAPDMNEREWTQRSGMIWAK